MEHTYTQTSTHTHVHNGTIKSPVFSSWRAFSPLEASLLNVLRLFLFLLWTCGGGGSVVVGGGDRACNRTGLD